MYNEIPEFAENKVKFNAEGLQKLSLCKSKLNNE